MPARPKINKKKVEKPKLSGKGEEPAKNKPQEKTQTEARLFEYYQDATWVYIGYPASKEETLGDLPKMMYRVKELARQMKLNIEITSVTHDAPGSIKVRVKTKEQALLLENLKLKLDKETTSVIKLYKGGSNRTFALHRFGPATNEQVYEAVRNVFGPEFSLHFREISGIRLGEALVRLKRLPRQIPKTIPVADWNINVVAPTSFTRGKCPLCGYNEHNGGCTDTIRYDPKMSTEEKARVEVKRAKRENKREERKDKRRKLRAERKKAKEVRLCTPAGEEMEVVRSSPPPIPDPAVRGPLDPSEHSNTCGRRGEPKPSIVQEGGGWRRAGRQKPSLR
ncbi:hypothetical protein BDZ91DRAFT_745262 [Kalaharituber pfeilii]|nr:hypothetical protein BDZ91DRAFT_745262 [Kalaharituber pfeilii]